jgi:hypothetical protein
MIHIMEKYKCVVCGYIYDPAEGDPSGGIVPGPHLMICLLTISALFAVQGKRNLSKYE